MAAPRLFGPAEPTDNPIPSPAAQLLGGSFAAAVGGDPDGGGDALSSARQRSFSAVQTQSENSAPATWSANPVRPPASSAQQVFGGGGPTPWRRSLGLDRPSAPRTTTTRPISDQAVESQYRRLADATIILARTGRAPEGLNPGEAALVRNGAAAFAQAELMGKKRDVEGYYAKVRTQGDWDFKEDRLAGLYPGLPQRVREHYGNWHFGASGAAWQKGRAGRVGAWISDHTGVGDDILRRGAGAYQIQSDVSHGDLHALKRLPEVFGYPTPAARYGDGVDGAH